MVILQCISISMILRFTECLNTTQSHCSRWSLLLSTIAWTEDQLIAQIWWLITLRRSLLMMLDCVSRAIAVAWAPVALSSNTLFKKPYSHKNSGKVAIHNIPTLLYLFFNFNVWILTHCTQRDAMGVRGAFTLFNHIWMFHHPYLYVTFMLPTAITFLSLFEIFTLRFALSVDMRRIGGGGREGGWWWWVKTFRTRYVNIRYTLVLQPLLLWCLMMHLFESHPATRKSSCLTAYLSSAVLCLVALV